MHDNLIQTLKDGAGTARQDTAIVFYSNDFCDVSFFVSVICYLYAYN